MSYRHGYFWTSRSYKSTFIFVFEFAHVAHSSTAVAFVHLYTQRVRYDACGEALPVNHRCTTFT